jgi:hypothetical protein
MRVFRLSGDSCRQGWVHYGREEEKDTYTRFFCVELPVDGKLVALWFWGENW